MPVLWLWCWDHKCGTPAQAQGLWRRLHGQNPDPSAGNKSKELREREAAEADAEWAGAGAKGPGQQRFTLVRLRVMRLP